MDRLELMDFISKVQEIKEKDIYKFYELKGFLKALADISMEERLRNKLAYLYGMANKYDKLN